MSYADDLIANSQGFAQRQQAAFDGAKSAADDAYDRSQDQAAQRAAAAGNYAGAIMSVANVPKSLTTMNQLQDRQAGIASQLMALSGNRQGAMQAAAQSGDPMKVAAAGATFDAETAHKFGLMARAANMVSQIPEEPGDASGDLNTRRAQFIQGFSPQLEAMGMSPADVQQLIARPRTGSTGHIGPDGKPVPPSGSLGSLQMSLQPYFNGTLKGQDGVETQFANGAPVAQGYVAPIIGKPGDQPLDPKTLQPLGPGVPAADFPVTGGDGVFSPRAGGMVASQPKPLEFTKTAAGETPGVFNPNAGPSAAPGASAATRADRNNNPGNLRPLPTVQGTWAGQTGVDAAGFAQFGSREAGMAAAERNLAAKQSVHGFTTLNQIIADPKAGWDPGNTGYAATVARDLGVRPDQPIDLSNPQVRQAVLGRIVAFESGHSGSGGSAPTYQALSVAKTPSPVSPAEMAALGYAPGTVGERDAAGNVKVTQTPGQGALPASQEKVIDAAITQAQKYRQLADMARQFVQLNQRQATGGLNTFAADAQATFGNQALGQMHSLQMAMLPLQRETGQGPIRMGEISGPGGGMWGGDIPRLELPAKTNAAIADEWERRAQLAQSYADFMDSEGRRRGSTAGLDGEWARQNMPSGGHTAQGASSGRPVAPSVGAVVKGYRFNGGNPAAPSSWSKVG